MESKEYLAAKHEFWNCIRMAPFSLFFSLIFAFKEWYPEMKRLKSHACAPFYLRPEDPGLSPPGPFSAAALLPGRRLFLLFLRYFPKRP